MGTPQPLHTELLPPKLRDLFFRPGPSGEPIYVPSRFKVAYGGRGSGKSWSFVRLALALASTRPLRVLCVREYQTSLKESVYQLLVDQIEEMGLSPYFEVQKEAIYGRQRYLTKRGWRRATFIFAGIKTDPGKVKSTEGVDLCLVEEAEKVSEASWKVLTPTIRKPGSEIWVCFNPREEKDPTYERFVAYEPHSCRRALVNWYDNPWFPAALQLDRQGDLKRIEDARAAGDDDAVVQFQADYDHVWGGECERRSDAAIFRTRVIVEPFEQPREIKRLFLGVDWGFAQDPTAMIRFWITDHKDAAIGDYQELWISHEAFGSGVELDEMHLLFDSVPDSRKWPIKADNARPESIAFMARRGFQITAAAKWAGSVEDGIAHLKAFRRIHIHPRCKRMEEEARRYSYKIDRITDQILPVVVDAFNHGWDAIRYGLDGYIQRRGVHALWTKLSE